MHIKLNRIQYPVFNLGPGKRIVIWTQGCSIRCKNCVSKSLWTTKKGKIINVDDLVEFITLKSFGFDGITITGGEPFDQSESVLEFCKKIKKKSNLNIFLFSGYTIEQLKLKEPKVFKYIDFILDGPYIESLHSNMNLKGSENQVLYTKKAQHSVPVHNLKYNSNKWTLTFENHKLYLTGIPKEMDLKNISQYLHSKGIEAKFRSIK